MAYPSLQELTEARAAGAQAFIAGLSKSINPYSQWGELGISWLRGYSNARLGMANAPKNTTAS